MTTVYRGPYVRGPALSQSGRLIKNATVMVKRWLGVPPWRTRFRK